ncbi:MAG: (d)CMP kinase [Flavobacteriaceae bacterium]|nr:(d)CMP kinase [Bacteroidia bacterium]NNL15059.1 (d)CMP kinase [Flavobacteriaceae bacterium]
MRNITIAIDGYSSTGKSTLAKLVAKRLGYVYVDSGAMYRAVTYYAMQNSFIENSKVKVRELIDHLPEIQISFKYNADLGFAEVYLNSINIEKQIRTLEVSSYVSQVSVIPEVRRQLVVQQQEMGKNKAVVMDGRDIGTVVFPKAELKVFLNASPETRAKRRYYELIEKGDNVSFQEVFRNVQERDYIDSNRKDSPLRKAKDAIEIDNSDLTKEQTFQKTMELVTMTLEGYE